jgi:hypothetical protein
MKRLLPWFLLLGPVFAQTKTTGINIQIDCPTPMSCTAQVLGERRQLLGVLPGCFRRQSAMRLHK